jgi:hypothetical protein
VRKIFEADPLTCGARRRIVSFITDPRVVDRILRHRESERCKAKDPFEPRAEDLFHAAQERPLEDRRAFLDEACGEEIVDTHRLFHLWLVCTFSQFSHF